MKYKVLILKILFSLLFFPKIMNAWTSPPLPPPPSSIKISTIPKYKTKIIKYVNYDLGQIKLDKKRLLTLDEELKRISFYKKERKQIKQIIIKGFSDKTPISDYNTIMNRLDISIRPSEESEINNELIAKGRAIFIEKYIEKTLNINLPINTIIESISSLEINGENRGIKVSIEFTSNYGIKKLPERITKLP